MSADCNTVNCVNQENEEKKLQGKTTYRMNHNNERKTKGKMYHLSIRSPMCRYYEAIKLLVYIKARPSQ